MNNSTLLILLTLAIVSLIDYIPRAFVWAKKAVKPETSYGPVPRYLIMPTVYGNISYLQNVSFLQKYSSKVVICTSKYESKEFYSDLRKACRKYGFRYLCVDLPQVNGRPIKNAYTIYRGALRDLNRLGACKDTPCLLMDADTYSNSNVNNLVRSFNENKFSIVSLRCEVSKPVTVMEQLQAFEYKLAMDNRRMDPWLTSGACNLARAGVFKNVFANHSNFFAGGDIEIGKIAQVMGYRVKHMDFTFYTAAPENFKAWYNQRLIWFAGGFRHHVANMGSFGWHHFFMLFYNSLLLYMLFPLRWLELINFPLTLLAAICLSWIYTAILAYGKDWKPVYLLLPFYAFIQSMFILPMAVARYFKLAWIQRSFGFLKYELSHIGFGTRILYKGLNISSTLFVLYTATSFTISRWQYWSQNSSLLNLMLR